MTTTRDRLQQAILDIFADALGRVINADEDFFAAGGDSLAAERVLSALSVHLSEEVPGWLLIDHPSAAALVAALLPSEHARPTMIARS